MSLTCLPAELLNLKFLTRLSLSGCLKLEELPEIKETTENLKVLNLDKTAIIELPSSLHHLVGLEELSLKSCTKLKTIPSSIGNLSKLLKLNLAHCASLETFPNSIFKLKLTELNFKGCSMLRTFPEIMEPAESFTHINLTETAIKDLPSSLEYLVGLQRLNLKLCSNLVSLPNSIVKLSLLSHLDCSGCCRLTEIPNNIGCLSSLTKLSLQESGIVNLPESMAHLSSLKSLNLNGCKLLECVPKLPPNLTQVQSFNCPSIKRMVLNSRLRRLVSDSKEGTYVFGLTNSQELDTTSRSDIVGRACIKITDDAYKSVFFYFPRSTVPRWIHYSCPGDSVTMKKDSPNLCSKNRLIGFALCAIMDGTRTNFGFRYNFRFISDGEIYSCNHFMPGDILNRDSSRLFLWKHPLDLEAIGNKLFHAENFTFEFQSDFKVKEFGMCPMYTKRIDDNSIEEPSGSKAAE
ncbi:hypothetical protein TSUD_81480 [Trifolium subterraneum]|uniref:Uncharacterized protein n=1 Tax=Trifolium subterraneum TaxID=3900 RepID=A0A2Z6PPE3_TRISU|nr:hypothetical protein TSUD_81480 [Trifolium subterraneum]